MSGTNQFEAYSISAVEKQNLISDELKFQLVNNAVDIEIERVLDVGCGAGYDLLPFFEKTKCRGSGVDIAENLGAVGRSFFENKGFLERVSFIRGDGGLLPFREETFDVVLCMVALPYMNNEKTLAEIARVLRPNGILFLQIHSPKFYFAMIRERFLKNQFKAVIYPFIALFAGVIYYISGKQIEGGIMNGKEMFQTESMIRRRFIKYGFVISGYLPSHNDQTPAFVVRKK
jgi:ubiquinone/menaquinone biosynthesis C-methylase UbiE